MDLRLVFLLLLPTVLATEPPHRHRHFHNNVDRPYGSNDTSPAVWSVLRIDAGSRDGTGNVVDGTRCPVLAPSIATRSDTMSHGSFGDHGGATSAPLAARNVFIDGFHGGFPQSAATMNAMTPSPGTASIIFDVKSSTTDPLSSALSGTSISATSDSVSAPSEAPVSRSKKGLAYNSAALTSAFVGKDVSWAYNWGADPGGSILPGLEFVPMLSGMDQIAAWPAAAAAASQGGSRHVLSFNEPDLSSQANIDPATAAANHIAHMNPLAGQMEIGSPAVTNGAGSNPLLGTDWLQEFFLQCDGKCHVDFVAFHWYDEASNFACFRQHVADVVNVTQMVGVSKVWLTEFGASGSDDEVASFLTQAVSFLDATEAVEKYAYFMCSNGILLDGGSISSPVGSAFAG